MLFIDGIVCDTKNGQISEDLRPLCLQAYESTLKKYHGWMVQQIFNVSYLINMLLTMILFELSNLFIARVESLPLEERSPY